MLATVRPVQLCPFEAVNHIEHCLQLTTWMTAHLQLSPFKRVSMFAFRFVSVVQVYP